MNLLPRRTISSIVLVVLLVLILAALAALQYRWSGQISESVHERMHASLAASMNHFRLQFNNEFQLLRHLIDHRGETLSREILLQEVWGYTSTPYTRTVDVHIAWLRQKIEDDPKHPSGF